MLEVICIDAKPRLKSFNQMLHLLNEGKTYIVSGTRVTRQKDGSLSEGYLLKELEIEQLKLNGYFNVERFIPLSEIDELELVEQKELVF